MATTVQEVYRKNILPLSETDRLQIAALIINDISVDKKNGGQKNGASKKIKDLFGSASLGKPTGASNESIDADLAREYADAHKD